MVQRIELKQKEVIGITTEDQRGVNNYFMHCKRIMAVESGPFKNGMGNRIEIYKIESTEYIGAIYPDGAAQIWPKSWLERGKILDPSEYENEETFSDNINRVLGRKIKRTVLLKKTKRTVLLDKPKKVKRTVLLKKPEKTKRRKLNV